MKRRILSIALGITMLVGLLPTTAMAADEGLYIGGVAMGNGTTVTYYKNGDTATPTGTAEDWNAKFEGNTLSLNGLTVTASDSGATKVERAGIYTTMTELTIDMKGDSSVTGAAATDEVSYGIYFDVVGASILTITGSGSLTVTGGNVTNTGGTGGKTSRGICMSPNGRVVVESGTLNANGGIVTGSSLAVSDGILGALTVNGGTVNATGGASSGKGHGIWTNAQDLTVTGGTVNAAAGTVDGTASYAVNTKNVYVSGGTLTATGGTASSGYSCGISTSSGTIAVSGSGKLEATGGKAKSESGGIFSWTDGTITVSDNGVLTALGGSVTYDSDSSYSCGIHNGNVTVSGGTLTATGGTVSNGLVSCGLYESEVSVTGGKLIAKGGDNNRWGKAGYSCGIYGEKELTVTGGTFSAIGGSSRNDDSYGCYYSAYSAPATGFLNGGSYQGKKAAVRTRNSNVPVHKLLAAGYGYYVDDTQLDPGTSKTSIGGTDTVIVKQTISLIFTDSDSYDIPVSTVGKDIDEIDLSAAVSGGLLPYKFSAVGLPEGISIDSMGIIYGVPTAAENEGTATITVTDNAGATASITIGYGAITEDPPASNHAHPICGKTHTDIGDHDDECEDITWTAWDGTSKISKDGNYYLSASAKASRQVEIQGTSEGPITVNLCLNGKNLDLDTWYLGIKNANVNLCDCQGGGTISDTDNQTVQNSGGKLCIYGGSINGAMSAIQNMTGGSVCLYGGTVSGKNYGIQTSGTGSITVNGGSIISSSTNGTFDSGIYASGEGSITVNGGAISGRSGIYRGGSGTVTIGGGTVTGYQYGIYLHSNSSGDVKVSGGSVNGGTMGIYTNEDSTGCINVSDDALISGERNGISHSGKGAVTVSGGSISSTKSVTGTSSCGIRILEGCGNVTVSGGTVSGVDYGIYNSGTLTLSGAPTFSGNTADIYLYSGKTVTVGDGGLRNTDAYTVKTSSEPTEDNPKKIVEACAVDYSTKFEPVDTSQYKTVRTDDTCLYLYVVTAAPITYTISVSADPAAGGTVTGGGEYAENTSVTVTATANSGYKFVKWTENGDEVSTDERYTFDVTENRDLVAVFEQVQEGEYEVSGTITGAEGSTYTSVTAKLIELGGNEYDATVDKTSGDSETPEIYHYATNAPAGHYNLVVTAKTTVGGNEVTVTSLIDLSSDTEKDAELPNGQKNSIVDATQSGEYHAIVGGLDECAEDVGDDDDIIEIKLTVTDKEEDTVPAADAAAIKEKAQGSKLEFLDFTLTKRVNDEEPANFGSENTHLLTIMIAFDKTGVNKDSIQIYRYHDNQAETMDKNPSSGEEGFVVGDGSITIYAKKFSTYAIGYTLEDTSSSDDPVVDNPSNNSSNRKPKYDVKYEAENTENGSVEVSRSRAAKGKTVTITVTPDDGYQLDELLILDKNGNEVAYKDKGDGKYTFVMPRGEVEIRTSFTEIEKEQLILIFTIDEKEYQKNHTELMNDVAPVIRSDRTMLPIRVVAESLGAKVVWSEPNQSVTITMDDKEIVIYVGQPFALVEGDPLELDSPAFIANDRTYLPMRFVAENLGATVTWDGVNQTVTIVG